MLNKLLQHKLRTLLVIVLIVLLALVRVFENYLFYDPFLNFFKSEYNTMPLPKYDAFNLFLSLFFRYFLNALLSILIIYTIFKDVGIAKFSAVLYAFFFVVLISYFFYLIKSEQEHNNLNIFYVRRFLIQPIFVLLFVPGLYYQKKFSKN